MKNPKPLLVNAGFTIVETLIVLAIGGLILLIIFEAIPTLQRSGRNNQRRQDVSLILSAVSHYELNNSGNFPVNCGPSSVNACTSDSGSNNNDYFLKYNKSGLYYYTDSSSQIVLQSSSPNTTINNPAGSSSDSVNIYNYSKCDPSVTGKQTPNGAGYNDVVALYAVETGGGFAQQCQQL